MRYQYGYVMKGESVVHYSYVEGKSLSSAMANAKAILREWYGSEARLVAVMEVL